MFMVQLVKTVMEEDPPQAPPPPHLQHKSNIEIFQDLLHGLPLFPHNKLAAAQQLHFVLREEADARCTSCRR